MSVDSDIAYYYQLTGEYYLLYGDENAVTIKGVDSSESFLSFWHKEIQIRLVVITIEQ